MGIAGPADGAIGQEGEDAEETDSSFVTESDDDSDDYSDEFSDTPDIGDGSSDGDAVSSDSLESYEEGEG